jgi:hypothetical protein
MKNMEWRQAKQTVTSGQKPKALCFNIAELFSHQSQHMTFLVVEADILLLQPPQDQEFGCQMENANLKGVFKVCPVWGSMQGQFTTI